MSKTVITILLPIHGNLQYLKETVNSIKLQTYNEWALIIGVNGYKKNSEEFNSILNEFSDINITVLDQFYIFNKSESLNEMMSMVTSEFTALIDGDDLWRPDKLTRQMDYVSEYDVIGTVVEKFDGDTGIIPTYIGDLTSFDFNIGNPLSNSSILMRSDIGIYWKDVHVEDYDLWYRLSLKPIKIFNLQEPLTLYRISNNTLTTRIDTPAAVKKIKEFYDSL
tara:strand:+ start:22645 stop:23310 length:666 start_codon:yes stop_codon:yes gene_type:complete